MTRVVLAKKTKKKAAKPVAKKRVRVGEGQTKVLHELDFGSDTFGRDLQYVFRKNVAKARRENKRIVGSTDFALPKH